MKPLTLYIDGIGWWTPDLPCWEDAKSAWVLPSCSNTPPATTVRPRRPAPALLPPAEQRRAPDTVVLALEVAAAAVAASGHDRKHLLSVFASAHGDLAITDAMCSTLARTPRLVSPTKFIHSVHNAPAGHWAMATQCHQASTALSAFLCSFAAGCLEAAMQCAADERAVLLVGYDARAGGAVAHSTQNEGTLAVALVLSPWSGPRSMATLRVEAVADAPAAASAATLAHHALAEPLMRNGMHDALALFEALAHINAPGVELSAVDGGSPNTPTNTVVLRLSSSLSLHLTLGPLSTPTLP